MDRSSCVYLHLQTRTVFCKRFTVIEIVSERKKIQMRMATNSKANVTKMSGKMKVLKSDFQKQKKITL
jgi:hypothetical protein